MPRRSSQAKPLSKATGLSSEERRTIAGRIATVQATIDALQAMPPALGSKWRIGMLQYYGAVLEELKSYDNGSSETKRSTKQHPVIRS